MLVSSASVAYYETITQLFAIWIIANIRNNFLEKSSVLRLSNCLRTVKAGIWLFQCQKEKQRSL